MSKYAYHPLLNSKNCEESKFVLKALVLPGTAGKKNNRTLK